MESDLSDIEPTNDAPQVADNSTAFDLSSMPGDLSQEASLQNFDSVEGLAKSYVHAVKKMGAPPDNFLKVPTKEGESWDDIYRAIGRPDSADQYVFEDTNDVEPGGPLDEFKEWAHKENLSNDQAVNILGELNSMISRGQEQQTQALEQGLIDGQQTLREDWPGYLYDQNLEYAQRTFNHFADEGVRDLFDKTGVGNNPAVLKFFAKVGKAMGESNLPSSGEPAQIGGLTPQSAQDTIQELYKDPEFLSQYRDNTNPNNKDANRRMDRLFKIAYPVTR